MGWISPDQVVPSEDAISYFTRRISDQPKDVAAYWMRARLLLQEKACDRARADIDRAIELEPKRAGLYVTRGMILVQQQQFDRALADCNRAIELDPQESWAFVVRANVWLSSRDYPRAVSDLREVIRIDSGNPLHWSVRFRYWLHVRDHDYAQIDNSTPPARSPISGGVTCGPRTETPIGRSRNTPNRSGWSRESRWHTQAARPPGPGRAIEIKKWLT
jgi:tetratricopeptide (TPR) repeat protein